MLPGWNSVDSAAAIAHGLHITAIVVLGLLFVAEGLALIYDSRKDTLAAVAEAARATAENAQRQQAEEHHSEEIAALKESSRWRDLSPDQQAKLKDGLTEFLSKYPMNVVIYRYEEPEAVYFATRIYEAFLAAGYSNSTQPSVRIQPIVGEPPETGIVIADQPAAQANALYGVFVAAAIPARLAALVKQGGTRHVGTEELLVEIWRKAPAQ